MKHIFEIIFFISIFIFFIHPFDGNGDFYHHISSGRYVLQNFKLPEADTFTHTARGVPWIAHSWACGVTFYLIFSSFGGIGISLFVALIAVITFLLIFILLRSYGFPKKAVFLTLALILAPISIRWPQRPEIIAYPLLISIFLVDQYRSKYKYLSFLFPLIILFWANFYGSGVILGLGILIILIIKQFILDKLKILPQQRIFYLSSLISLPISLINGYGFKTIFYIFFYIPKVSQYEGEWAGIGKILSDLPLSYLLTYQYYLVIYFLFLALFIFLIIVSFKILPKYIFFSLLALSIFIPIFAFRHLTTTVILSAPLLSTMISYQLDLKRKIPIVIAIIVAVFLVGLSLFLNPPKLVSPQNPALDQMIAFVEKNNLSGKAFNHVHLGGFLTYSFYPKVLTFIDTRDDLFNKSPALIDLYETFNLNKSVLPLLSKYKIDLVFADIMADGLSYKALFYSQDWSIVYFNDRYFLAVPKNVAIEKNLNPIDFLDPYSQTGSRPGMEEKAAQYFQKLIDNGSNLEINRSFLSLNLISLGEADQAIKTMLEEINPDNYLLLSESYLKLNDCQKAKQYLDKAQKDQPFIFPFIKQNPLSKINKTQSFYSLICKKDKTEASYFQKLFLSQPEISPLEKARFVKEFNNYSILP